MDEIEFPRVTLYPADYLLFLDATAQSPYRLLWEDDQRRENEWPEATADDSRHRVLGPDESVDMTGVIDALEEWSLDLGVRSSGRLALDVAFEGDFDLAVLDRDGTALAEHVLAGNGSKLIELDLERAVYELKLLSYVEDGSFRLRLALPGD